MTPSQYVTELLRRFPNIVYDEIKKQQSVLAVYISDNMNVGAHPSWDAAKKRYKRPYVKNATNKVYTNTNRLYAAATTKGKPGNVIVIERQSTMVKLTIGVDLNVVPYARIHELGGLAGRGRSTRIPARPYIAPALKAYEKEEMPNFIDKIYAKLGAIG